MVHVSKVVRKTLPLRAMSNLIKINRVFSKNILNKIDKFKPHLQFNFENNKYYVKMAQDGKELKQALQLRHHVFYEELLHRKKLLGIDVDKFDFKCDHLLLFEKTNNSLIGTYRFNSSRFTNHFYSSTEFDIKRILALPGHKMELGRACIHQHYRNNYVIALLWKGINEYLKATESKYLFGCSSLHTTDIDEIIQFYFLLKQKNNWTDEFKVKPRKNFKIKHFKKHVKNYSARIDSEKVATDSEIHSSIPPLIRFYLRAGALLCGEPVIDKDFQCTDFFTLLNSETLDTQFNKKFSFK